MAVTFDRDEIKGALRELVDLLIEANASSHIRIVGGAAVALRFERGTTTTDVDALYGSDRAVEEAAQTIARHRGWPADWLNNDVKMWTSHFDEPADWERFVVRRGVSVSLASPRLLLAMKLRAARGRRDARDIDLLLDACGIEGTADALAVFAHYYPDDEPGRGALRQLRSRFDDVG